MDPLHDFVPSLPDWNPNEAIEYYNLIPFGDVVRLLDETHQKIVLISRQSLRKNVRRLLEVVQALMRKPEDLACWHSSNYAKLLQLVDPAVMGEALQIALNRSHETRAEALINLTEAALDVWYYG